MIEEIDCAVSACLQHGNEAIDYKRLIELLSAIRIDSMDMYRMYSGQRASKDDGFVETSFSVRMKRRISCRCVTNSELNGLFKLVLVFYKLAVSVGIRAYM